MGRQALRPPGESRYAGYLYVLPAFAVFATFVLYPLLHAAYLSLWNWDGLTVATWAGLALATALLAGGVARLTVGGAVVLPALWLYEAVLSAVAVALCLGARRPSGPVMTDLVVELGEARSATAREALARALGDPSLQVGYWRPAVGRYEAGRLGAQPQQPRRRVGDPDVGGGDGRVALAEAGEGDVVLAGDGGGHGRGVGADDVDGDAGTADVGALGLDHVG